MSDEGVFTASRSAVHVDEYEATPQQMAKAEAMVRHHLVRRDEEVPAIWWVTSARDPEQVYRVQSDVDEAGEMTWITCTCPHGLHSGGGWATCYHAAAVVLLIRSEALH